MRRSFIDGNAGRRAARGGAVGRAIAARAAARGVAESGLTAGGVTAGRVAAALVLCAFGACALGAAGTAFAQAAPPDSSQPAKSPSAVSQSSSAPSQSSTSQSTPQQSTSSPRNASSTQGRPDARYPNPSGQDSQPGVTPPEETQRPHKAPSSSPHTASPAEDNGAGKDLYTGGTGKKPDAHTACSTPIEPHDVSPRDRTRGTRSSKETVCTTRQNAIRQEEEKEH